MHKMDQFMIPLEDLLLTLYLQTNKRYFWIHVCLSDQFHSLQNKGFGKPDFKMCSRHSAEPPLMREEPLMFVYIVIVLWYLLTAQA